jgi:hypothetical protein
MAHDAATRSVRMVRGDRVIADDKQVGEHRSGLDLGLVLAIASSK